MSLIKRTKTYTVTSIIWLTVLLGVLAYVFVITGCSPVGSDVEYVQGPKGDPGLTGPAGADGLTVVGPVGPAGLDGKNGTNASIGIIPLCLGVSTHSTFVEVALCINKDLYAVYSANGGFMTYLAPGAYSSDGIGAACNLTVHANCVVTH